MKTYLVVTITCPDRPGVVERITQAVVDHSANWEDSRMARLGGDFAGIVKIGVEEDRVAELVEALQALADEQTTVIVKATGTDVESSRQQFSLWELRLAGADHEGIVHKVSAYLASEGINVESMETTVAPAPISGSPLFHMEAVIKVPSDRSLSELNEKLGHIGEDLGVDVGVVPRRE